MPPFPVLYPITDRALSGGRSHAELARELCRGGARWIQIREKALGGAAMLAETTAAVRAAGVFGARVIVNDRADIAVMAGAAGVHLGAQDLPVAAARRIVGADALVGCSTHSVEEAIHAAALPVDYVALGPIFATRHASVPRAPLGLDAVRRAAAAISIPIVAIGGIDPERARQVLRVGAAAVAVLGDLMSAADIAARAREYPAPDRHV
ncbi:MAG: thiamine phosphate synthase [Acidobacteriota bacterium]